MDKTTHVPKPDPIDLTRVRPEALKARFPGQILAVHAPQPMRVREALAGASGVRSALLVGDHIHLFVDSAARRLPELQSRLDEVGIPCEPIHQVAASIEDVFISAVESELSTAAGTKLP